MLVTRLSILLKTFSILSKNLSEILHIDCSLISKWRSGKRALKPDSIYVGKIVDYVMDLDKPNQYIKIRRLLSDEQETIFSQSEAELRESLRGWLANETMPIQKDTVFDELKYSDLASIGTIYKFKGAKGRCQAVKFQFDYANAHAPGLEMWCYTEEEAAWLYDNPEFLKHWTERNTEFLRGGNTVKIIHPMSRTYDNTAISILRWMPLHMTGNTYAYYISNYREEPISHTMFLIPNHLALFNVSSKLSTGPINTFMTDDITMIESLQSIMQTFFAGSIPIFKPYRFSAKPTYYEDFMLLLQSKKAKYSYSAAFQFFPLSEDAFRKIAACNRVGRQQMARSKEQYSNIAEMIVNAQCRYLINPEKLANLLLSERVVLDGLSFIAGTVISVPSALFLELVDEILQKSHQYPGLELGITESQQLSDLGNISLFVQEIASAEFFCACQEEPLSLRTKELTVVTSLFHRMEKIWNSIPPLNRDKNFVCTQLRERLMLPENQG